MEFFSTVGEQVGYYVGSLYGGYVLSFLLPLFMTAPFFWLAYRYLKPIPEPDYRRPLVGIAGGQLLYFGLFSLIWPGPSAGFMVIPLALAFLAGVVWMLRQPGNGSVLWLGLCELASLAFVVYGFLWSPDGYATAAMLGALVPILGGLLWVAVGLRSGRIQARGRSA